MEQSDNTLQQHHHPQRHPARGRGGRAGPRPHRPEAMVPTASRHLDTQANVPAHDERQPRNTRPHRHPPRSDQPTDEPAAPSTAIGGSIAPSHPPRPSRRAKFKARLTEPAGAQASSTAALQHDPPAIETRKPKPRRTQEPPGDDLTSTLTRALRAPPFLECPICFSPIRPEQSTWSCSPPTSTEVPVPGLSEDKDGDAQCCWSTFHLKCIRAWADKSVKELEEAWRARGESRPGEWRCPGCRATRQVVPQTYMCFCLRMRHPAPPRMATPHSCAQPCSRPRSGCRHACPLPCHPGPCPPCAVTIQVTCSCGKERRSMKCQVRPTSWSPTCAQPCLKRLRCSNSEHLCAETCHKGPCPPCPREEDVRCWCGRETKRVACGEVKVADGTECVVVKDDGSEQVWTGSYGCGHPCERPFACSYHRCSKICHPPSPTSPPCPFDPERVTSCACGRCRITRSPDEFAASHAQGSSAALLPPRTSCTSPLPTCTSLCSKPLPCGHLCQATCHWEPCPPCTEQVERTCRCGATRHKTPCSDTIFALQPAKTTSDSNIITPASEVVLCDKPCQAFRSCGRHQCGRICCPLAFLASLQRTAAKSTKQRDAPQALHTDPDSQFQLQLDPAMRALHDCELPCGRVLTCGNHRCQRRDHKGPCDACPRGVFDELVCLCGRMVLEPPIQCGTKLRCVYPCARSPPVCGHPHVPHGCHEGVVIAGVDTADEGLGLAEEEIGGACPPCPFLTEKMCACGKKRVSNVRCSQERVSCGSVCGKPLSCGFHHCERRCHTDTCGTCTAVCGKSRKSCLPAQHPCTQTCHAPAACPETEACLAPVMLTCPCGNLRSTIPCSGTKLTLACTGECEIKKRNTRLAEALGISEEKRETKGRVTWPADLAGSGRALGPKFVGIVEKALADFIVSDRHTQVLPHMPPERRKFVHDMASVYRMDTVIVDQEPHRSVQLIRRIDTRMPAPLLSQFLASTGTGVGIGIGRLVNLRSVSKESMSKEDSASGSLGTRWAGTSGSHGTGTGTGKWNMVVKSTLGAARSGSTTPARVPSPAGGVVGSHEVSPGPSRVSGAGAGTDADMSVGTRGGKRDVWVSPSVRAQRARESALVTGDALIQNVPDDWEDEG